MMGRVYTLSPSAANHMMSLRVVVTRGLWRLGSRVRARWRINRAC